MKVSISLVNYLSLVIELLIVFCFSGARVVPIKDTIADSELTSLLNSLNGIVFPGGILSLTTSNYSRVATKVYQYAMAAHDKGDYFPIIGLCWGVQMLFKLVAGVNLLRRTYSSHIDLKVILIANKLRQY